MFEFLNNLALGIGWLFIVVFVGAWVIGSVVIAIDAVEKLTNKRPNTGGRSEA